MTQRQTLRERGIRLALLGSLGAIVVSMLANPAAAADLSAQSTGVLGDRVWLDADFDGVFDIGEVGLAGVTVDLAWNDGSPQTASTTTDADGLWSVGSLAFDVPITVTVDALTLPGNVTPTHDFDDSVLSGPIGTPHSAEVTLTAGSPTNLALDFGYLGQGEVGDTLWFDIDGDGAAAPAVEDILLEGVDVTVTWPGANGGTDYVVTTTTDENGFWVVQGLPEGNVTVDIDSLTLPTGLVGTLDPDGGFDNTATVALIDDGGTLADETINYAVDFAWTGGASIADLVWYDLDGDGVKDPSESGIASMTVEVVWYDLQANPHTWSAVTNGSGIYSIDGLPAGFLSVSVPTASGNGLVPTYDVDEAHDGTANISLTAGQDRTDVDFGFRDSADVRVAVSSAEDFRLGETNKWTIDVDNLGPGNANAPLTVSVQLPDGASYSGVSGTGSASWSCTPQAAPNDHLVDCDYLDGAMADSTSTSFDLEVGITANAVPTANVQVSVQASSSDAVPTNNTDTDNAPVPFAELDVTMTRLDDLVAGSLVTYRMGVTNVGPSPTSGGVTLVDDLPVGLAYDSFSGDGWSCGPSNGDVVCIHLGLIPVGLTANVDLELLVVGSAGESVSNTVTVTGGNEVNGSPLDAGAVQAVVGIVDDTLNETIQTGGGATTTTTTSTTTTTTPGGSTTTT
ncbi:MAG: hypothetical protein KDB16_00485, partial [Acidimicrobiales bacterium]|nr:hypothetical protein [Acidimicrobiales bacterium]